jgi:hypothetical protein
LARSAKIQSGFLALGFVKGAAFYNVCKSLDTTLNGFRLLAFWNGQKVSKMMMAKLESILEVLKNE